MVTDDIARPHKARDRAVHLSPFLQHLPTTNDALSRFTNLELLGTAAILSMADNKGQPELVRTSEQDDMLEIFIRTSSRRPGRPADVASLSSATAANEATGGTESDVTWSLCAAPPAEWCSWRHALR